VLRSAVMTWCMW